jgi:hypothetical protein
MDTVTSGQMQWAARVKQLEVQNAALVEALTFLVDALESQNPQPQMSMSVRINLSNARKLIAKHK